MKNKGFTFVELLVVITIIGVIFASGIVAYSSITMRSRDARRRADLEAIRQSLEMCRSLTGTYPLSILEEISCSGDGPTLMGTVPIEPKAVEGCAATYTYIPQEPSYTSYVLSACNEYEVTQPIEVRSP